MTIELDKINWLAVMVAGLAAFMIGGVWYSALFANAWTKAQGWSEQHIAELKAKMSPPRFFGGMIVSYLIVALALAVLAFNLGIASAGSGAALGGIVWFAIAAVVFTNHLASGKVIAGYLIDAGCALVYMPTMGAIIGAWR